MSETEREVTAKGVCFVSEPHAPNADSWRMCNLRDGHEGAHSWELGMPSIPADSQYRFLPNRREVVDHPRHYGGDTTYEAIKVIEAWKLNFNLGNTVKYVRRAEQHGTHLEDLKKARWYLDREIQNLEKGQ